MSQADALLDSLARNTPATYGAGSDPEAHIVIDKHRRISVPEELRRIAVQHDHNVETVTFDCPRYWDEHDMSKMAIFINYMRADEYMDSYPVDDVTIDENDPEIMHFRWTISRNLTAIAGRIVFMVCVKDTDDTGSEKIHWNSELSNDMYVSDGMECPSQIVEENYDLIAQLLRKVTGVISVPISGFFTLSVDENGDLFVYSEAEGAPEFEYDSETGALYVVQEQE